MYYSARFSDVNAGEISGEAKIECEGNGFIRAYCPGSTGLDSFEPAFFAAFTSKINFRPRKRFGWRIFLWNLLQSTVVLALTIQGDKIFPRVYSRNFRAYTLGSMSKNVRFFLDSLVFFRTRGDDPEEQIKKLLELLEMAIESETVERITISIKPSKKPKQS